MYHGEQIQNRLTWAEISLAAIKHNLQLVSQCAPRSKIIAVLKADAYGHGAFEVSQCISADVNAIAVARLEEAEALRQQSITSRLIVLSPLMNAYTISKALALNLDLVVHSKTAIDSILSTTLPKPLAIWLKIDTGMHRLGISPSIAIEATTHLLQHPNLTVMALLSHFSSTDDVKSPKTNTQLSVMDSISQHFPDLDVCFANSGGILFHPSTQFDWVRSGIMLYGVNPSDTNNAISAQLRPAMTLKSRVLDVRPVNRGEPVGYNERWVAKQDTAIATIAIGYADGYPRHAKSGTPVLIRGKRYTLAGRVSMDLITVDVGLVNDIKPGDEVILWGKDLPITEISENADTIAYDLMTGISHRVMKYFVP